MYYYKIGDKICCSFNGNLSYEKAEMPHPGTPLTFLFEREPGTGRDSFKVNSPLLLFQEAENVSWLSSRKLEVQAANKNCELDEAVKAAIAQGVMRAVNRQHPDFGRAGLSPGAHQRARRRLRTAGYLGVSAIFRQSRGGMPMSGKLLLFGFESLLNILALEGAVKPFQVELVPVGRTDYNKPMAVLAGLDTLDAAAGPMQPYAGGPLGGSDAGAVRTGRSAG